MRPNERYSIAIEGEAGLEDSSGQHIAVHCDLLREPFERSCPHSDVVDGDRPPGGWVSGASAVRFVN